MSTKRHTHAAHAIGHRHEPKSYSHVICRPTARKSFKCRIIDVPAVACMCRQLYNTVCAIASIWANTIAPDAIEIKYRQYRHVSWIGRLFNSTFPHLHSHRVPRHLIVCIWCQCQPLVNSNRVETAKENVDDQFNTKLFCLHYSFTLQRYTLLSHAISVNRLNR